MHIPGKAAISFLISSLTVESNAEAFLSFAIRIGTANFKVTISSEQYQRGITETFFYMYFISSTCIISFCFFLYHAKLPNISTFFFTFTLFYNTFRSDLHVALLFKIFIMNTDHPNSTAKYNLLILCNWRTLPITRERVLRRNLLILTKSVKQVFTIMQRSISKNISSFINRHFFSYGGELTQVRPKSFNTFTICQSDIYSSPWAKLDLKLTINPSRVKKS